MEKKQEEEEGVGEKQKETWEGSVTAKVRRGTRNQVWSMVGDYLSLDKWLPNITTCTLVEGVPGQPGCVRYCATSPPTDITGEEAAAPFLWVNERLLTLDPIGHSLSYEIKENNMGLTRYMATLKVVGGGDEDEDEAAGCCLEWSFEADPVDGMSEESLVSYLQDGLDAMAAKVEVALDQP